MITHDLKHQRVLNDLKRYLYEATSRLRGQGKLTGPGMLTEDMVEEDTCTVEFFWEGMDATRQVKISSTVTASWGFDSKVFIQYKIFSPALPVPHISELATGWRDEIKSWAFDLEQMVGVLEEAQELDLLLQRDAWVASTPDSASYATVDELEAVFAFVAELEQRIEELEKEGYLTREEVETYKAQTAVAKNEAKGGDTKRDIQLAVVKLWLWFQARGVIGRKLLQSDKVASGVKGLLPEGAPIVDLVTGAADALLGKGE